MVVGLAADGDVVAARPRRLADGRSSLVVGSEGNGPVPAGRARPATVSSASRSASDTESLNAGVAAGIALYAAALHGGPTDRTRRSASG